MRASLDTNIIIHFYKAGKQDILFDLFDEGLVIYEQIRDIELENHGQEILKLVDKDIDNGRIVKYTDTDLKNLGVLKIFEYKVKENKYLYGPGDLGEVYAISLAQTLGTYSLLSDDIKQGGPYMSLLQFEEDVMPFNFVDILLLRYLFTNISTEIAMSDFDEINKMSNLNWDFSSNLKKFIRRFWREPYRTEDRDWINKFLSMNEINAKEKMYSLYKVIK